MALVPIGGSRLTHLLVAIFPHPSYLPSWKCHRESFDRQTFSFTLTSCLLSLFLFYPSYLSLSHTARTCFIPSCVKLSVSCSPGNRLTFALEHCSNLLALKYMNRQNPTLHFRHGKISATMTSPLSHQHMAVYWSVFMCMYRCWRKHPLL